MRPESPLFDEPNWALSLQMTRAPLDSSELFAMSSMKTIDVAHYEPLVVQIGSM